MKIIAAVVSGLGIFSLAGCQVKGGQQETQVVPATGKEQYIIHKADSRGESKADWLRSRHTFSFNDYYDPTRTGFGTLLVINDDWVKGGAGFPRHHHREMEIVSIPLHGGIAHKDSKGSEGITSVNRTNNTYSVQLMTAGSGIAHSEYNASSTDSVSFLQIWVKPARKGLEPSYKQMTFSFEDQQNAWQTLLEPGNNRALPIQQQAVFNMTDLDAGKTIDYSVKYGGGVYVFIIEGQTLVNGNALFRRDGMAITNTSQVLVRAVTNAKILLMEVPMQGN